MCATDNLIFVQSAMGVERAAMGIAERIRQARKEKRLSQGAVAEATGTTQSNVSQWESGRHTPSRAQVQRLADLFGRTVAWIETGDAPDSGHIQPVTSSLPVLGEAQAGAWKEVFAIDEGEAERVPVPEESRIPGARQYWIRVVGDSVDKKIPSGSLALCCDVWDWARDADDLFARANGKLVVCQRERAGLFETTIKELRVSGRKAELWPASNNPKHNGPVPLGDTADTNGVSIVAVVTEAMVRL